MPEKTSEQQYELTFILGEKVNLEEGKTKTEMVKKFLKTIGGNVTKEELWGRRELAYEIAHNRTGFYVTLWLDLPKDQLKAVDEFLRFDVDIIRSLVTKAYTEAQPGSLYPVVEEEKPERSSNKKEEAVTGEEMLRRSTSSTKKEKTVVEKDGEDIPDEERLKKLDESLEELLKDEE